MVMRYLALEFLGDFKWRARRDVALGRGVR